MRKTKTPKGTILFGIIFFCIPFIGHANPVDSNLTIFKKFVTDSIRHITIEADFDSLFNYKKLTAEQKAKLTFKNPDGTTQELGIKVKTRGVYRRMRCEIPPLRLNFNDRELDSMGLNKAFDKLKLVTHCVENENAEQVLLKEYWTYKLYNELTPNSFKVHLVKITYINTRDKANQTERFAFLIENNNEMAHRLGGELVDKFGLTPNQLDASTHQNTMLFNYMIGNLDWHIERQRNIKLVQIPNKKEITVVPYDFDMSAIVFPSYARLNPDYGQENFTERFCVGRFSSPEALAETAQKFIALKTDCLTAFTECPYLTNKSKIGMTVYMKSFYRQLNKKKKMKKTFL